MKCCSFPDFLTILASSQLCTPISRYQSLDWDGLPSWIRPIWSFGKGNHWSVNWGWSITIWRVKCHWPSHTTPASSYARWLSAPTKATSANKICEATDGWQTTTHKVISTGRPTPLSLWSSSLATVCFDSAPRWNHRPSWSFTSRWIKTSVPRDFFVEFINFCDEGGLYAFGPSARFYQRNGWLLVEILQGEHSRAWGFEGLPRFERSLKSLDFGTTHNKCIIQPFPIFWRGGLAVIINRIKGLHLEASSPRSLSINKLRVKVWEKSEI